MGRGLQRSHGVFTMRVEQAQNPLTSPDDLRLLATTAEGDRQVALCLIRNPNTPMDIMRLLFTSFKWDVAHRLIMLDHPNLDPVTLNYLARRSFTGDIYRAVARHPNTSADTLRFLWSNQRGGYGEWVSNPNTPWYIVRQIKYRLLDTGSRWPSMTLMDWVPKIFGHANAPYGLWQEASWKFQVPITLHVRVLP